MHSDDDPLIATVEEEITDSETKAAFNPKPSKNLLEIGESTDGDRFIKRSRKCTADKSGNGCGYSTDGWHTTWDLFDVNAGVGRHGTVLTRKELPLTGIISMVEVPGPCIGTLGRRSKAIRIVVILYDQDDYIPFSASQLAQIHNLRSPRWL